MKTLSRVIDAPSSLSVVPSVSDGFGAPHVEITDSEYHYVVAERGIECERRRTSNIDELLYWILGSITFDMACTYELSHRNPTKDFRRLLFAHQLELVRKLDSGWAERRSGEIDAILAKHPFDDPSGIGG
ncbi:MAG: hypothetical protein CMJ48_09105 [Planctomycetaceae bacterium]|nr:hypothetical protein [Planctomycetaceae bacterium]